MVLAQTPLCNGIHPVGIVVVLLVLRECRIVVQLTDVRGSVVLFGVEVRLLQEHRVVVTAQHLIALRLIGACETERIGELRRTARTTLCGDLDDTVSTLRTVDGRSGGILQHGDAGDILRVHVQQLCELLVVGTGQVEVRHIDVPRVAVDNDERVGIGERTD